MRILVDEEDLGSGTKRRSTVKLDSQILPLDVRKRENTSYYR